MPKILSLDVEEETLGLLNTIFKRAGYEHLHTTNSNEALSILRKGDIDLFTQNILRADMDGCEFYRLMQSEDTLRDIPVLIISSLTPPLLPKYCKSMLLQLYPHHFIPMPFGQKKLLAVVAAILESQTSTRDGSEIG